MSVSTLIVTAGSATANSYCSLAVAEQYHLDRPPVGTTWEVADDEQKSAALLWATTLLDRLFVWRGWVANVDQRLMWPRIGLMHPNGLKALDHDSIPELIQFATAEYARQLLVSDLTGDSEVQAQGLTSLKVGPIQMMFKDSIYTKRVPDVVSALIPRTWGYAIDSPGAGERELERA